MPPAPMIAMRIRSVPEFPAAGYDAHRQAFYVSANLARPRQPDAIAMLRDVLDHAAEVAQAVRLAQDEGMQDDGHHQGPARRFREHLVELVDEVIAEKMRRRATRDALD